jgi:hypothetical protein
VRAAFLTAACLRPDHPQRRADWWEHDKQFPPVRDACRARGIELVEAVWDDPAVRPDDFDAFVIGTTWDYQHRVADFLATLEAIAARRPLFNPLPAVRWNVRKTYLADLAGRGVPVVPTRWVDRADAAAVEAAFDSLRTDEVVVKPVVGASAWRQCRVRRGAPLPPAGELPPGEAMIQPFLPAAAEEGEYAYVFLGGEFSHSVRKIPAPGDYRVQSLYGGTERAHRPSPADLARARSVLDAAGGPLLYARVDLVRGTDGALALMELELVEPYLYPDQGPGMGEAFAAALERALAGAATTGSPPSWRSPSPPSSGHPGTS